MNYFIKIIARLLEFKVHLSMSFLLYKIVILNKYMF